MCLFELSIYLIACAVVVSSNSSAQSTFGTLDACELGFYVRAIFPACIRVHFGINSSVVLANTLTQFSPIFISGRTVNQVRTSFVSRIINPRQIGDVSFNSHCCYFLSCVVLFFTFILYAMPLNLSSIFFNFLQIFFYH